jgi:hypothetical protein
MGEVITLNRDRSIYLPDGSVYSGRPRCQVLKEVHECPREIQAQICRKLGRNRFDGPLYRVVWGWNRLDWVAGQLTRFDDNGNYLREEYGVFLEPKYSYLGRERLNRWILERWYAPEEYGSRESWEFETAEIEGYQEFQALGPYPSRGDYELVQVIEDSTGEFLQLEPEIVDYLIWACEASRELQASKRKERLREEQEREEAKRRALYSDVFDDAAPAFGGVPNSTQANAPRVYKRDNLKDIGAYRAPSSPGMSQV